MSNPCGMIVIDWWSTERSHSMLLMMKTTVGAFSTTWAPITGQGCGLMLQSPIVICCGLTMTWNSVLMHA